MNRLINLMNFMIGIYRQSDTICSFVEPFSTTYSNESSDFGYYEIHLIGIEYHIKFKMQRHLCKRTYRFK